VEIRSGIGARLRVAQVNRQQETLMIKSILPLLFLLSPPAAGATIYYVAPTGNDANPGTAAQPFRAVGKGTATAAASGDAIQVAAGMYSEHITWTNKTLNLQGAGPGLSLI